LIWQKWQVYNWYTVNLLICYITLISTRWWIIWLNDALPWCMLPDSWIYRINNPHHSSSLYLCFISQKFLCTQIINLIYNPCISSLIMNLIFYIYWTFALQTSLDLTTYSTRHCTVRLLVVKYSELGIIMIITYKNLL
jgi:hypothetical protein